MQIKCTVVGFVGGKMKTYPGRYESEELVGTFTKGGVKKCGFVIPESYKGGEFLPLVSEEDKEKFLKAVESGQIKSNPIEPLEGAKKPVFFVDFNSGAAVPLGKTIIVDSRFALRLESILNKRVVKALSKRTLDTLELIITLFAGAGMLYMALKLIAIFTKQVITL